jgi:hypothetical protein
MGSREANYSLVYPPNHVYPNQDHKLILRRAKKPRKLSFLTNKNMSSQKNNKNSKPPSGQNIQTPTKGKKSSEPTSESHFSSSAFLNSPDPSMLPIPIFDDEPLTVGAIERNVSATTGKR